MSELVRDALFVGGTSLAHAGIDTAVLDAELLLAHVLGIPRGRLLPAQPITDGQRAEFERLVARRTAREPLQHVVGDAAFRHVVVPVGAGVFVPRPETELLVDAVLPTLRAAAEPVAVDLCSGSGALALALADEVPGARVVALERPGSALDWLTRNTAQTRVEVVGADVADADALAGLRAGVDAVVCNPPYVPAATEVGAEVRFDPPEAVFAGPEGLDLMSTVIARAAELLHSGGVLAVEHDETHAESVPALLRAHGAFVDVTDNLDLAGRPRYATATRT
ncbi:peptide chain release factor N(5)-glutamine methyltransferase [uncultured Jatrophihabitans sp.]|uniref:peptide chain release factor N(5)-glutamine methyltransferase n=1 Tax=uncultured Jatrophihabitans sp. TaxID=1610747 RepID=UPI0035C9E0E3